MSVMRPSLSASLMLLRVSPGTRTNASVKPRLANRVSNAVFGTADRAIDSTYQSQNGAWYLQVAVVVFGHVCAPILAHDRALALYRDTRLAVRSQYWMLAVMVGFTSLALWLLSQATV